MWRINIFFKEQKSPHNLNHRAVLYYKARDLFGMGLINHIWSVSPESRGHVKLMLMKLAQPSSQIHIKSTICIYCITQQA